MKKILIEIYFWTIGLSPIDVWSLMKEQCECRCYISKKMSSLLVVMSRSWSRPRIFIIIFSITRVMEDRHCIHIDIYSTRWEKRKIDNERQWVREQERECERKKVKKYLSLTNAYVRFFSLPSIYFDPPIIDSLIQLLYIRSSTKISIHLRMVDVA